MRKLFFISSMFYWETQQSFISSHSIYETRIFQPRPADTETKRMKNREAVEAERLRTEEPTVFILQTFFLLVPFPALRKLKVSAFPGGNATPHRKSWREKRQRFLWMETEAPDMKTRIDSEQLQQDSQERRKRKRKSLSLYLRRATNNSLH